MKNLDHRRIGHEIEQRLEVHAIRQRVDRGKPVLAGDLHQAELRPVGSIAHELGIDRDIVFTREFLAKLVNLGGGGQ